MRTFALGKEDAELLLGVLENETHDEDHVFLKRALHGFIDSFKGEKD